MEKKKTKNVLSIVKVSTTKFVWAAYKRICKGNWQCLKQEIFIDYNSFLKSIKKLKGQWIISGNAWRNIFGVSNKISNLAKFSNINFPKAKDIIPIAQYHYNKGVLNSSLNIGKLDYLIGESTWKKLKFQKKLT